MAEAAGTAGTAGRLLGAGATSARTPGDTSEMPGWGQLPRGPTSAKPGGAETPTLLTPSFHPLRVPREPKHRFAMLGTPAPDWLRPQNPARSKGGDTLAPVFGVLGCRSGISRHRPTNLTNTSPQWERGLC